MRSSDIAGYDIVAKLGTGGMADVYLASKQGAAGFTRPVVLKKVRDSLKDLPEFVDMFVDEARLSSRIQHANVVQVEELGEVDGQFFMVMEYVHGVELGRLLKALAHLGRHLTADAVVAIASEVAAGLHAAHEARDDSGRSLHLVHRDISPQNILLGSDGRIKVIDFGIAKASHRLYQTEGHAIKGKLRYMSPDQIEGEVDRRSDLFALGIVIWEMLTGQRLFAETDDMEVLRRIKEGDIPPPSRFASVPPQLEAIVMRTLSVDPAQRPQTARELRQELQRAVPSSEFDEGARSALLLATLGGELEDRARRLMVPLPSPLNTSELSTEPALALQRFTTTPGAAAATPTLVDPSLPPTLESMPAQFAAGSSQVTPQFAPVPEVGGHGKWLVVGVLLLVVGAGVGALLLWSTTKPDATVAPVLPRAPTQPALTEAVPPEPALPAGEPSPEAQQALPEQQAPLDGEGMEPGDDPPTMRPEAPRMHGRMGMRTSEFPIDETNDPFGDDF